MFHSNVRILLSIAFALSYGCSSELNSPQFAAANALTNCEFEVTGTSSPPSSGVPTVISSTTGTVISANFFNSGAIDPPYFDGNEYVSVCVSNPDASGNRTASITSDVGLDNDFNIKGYPQFVIGTKFGNIFETSYRYYQNTGLPTQHQWPVTSTNLSSQNTPFEFANLEYVSAVKGVGLPAFTNNLPNIAITLDIDETNVIGAERDIMLESWFYDTSANASIIGNNVATGTPIANTLNNIVGVGHPHYAELDNTLLEMMVHLGSLSPHDVSLATNNPGQNQLTEEFSGKDFDLDGIDDHFDVDSHTFVNSNNPADPNPGIYSSGIDANGDGIDDADILPIQFGEHLYSIWYGQSFLSPIVIYSRESNTSLLNDFDPTTPDMDLTNEGEIELPWNEFLNFTLNNVQPLLQTAGVPWASGNNNIFDKMSASGGAVSGLEFGVEPQTNNAADEPYIVSINKFKVDINGSNFGISGDTSTIPLTIGGAPTGHYGHRHADNLHRDEVSFSFDGNSTDLALSAVGFDIDLPTEVEVILNGSSIGFLSTGPNNQHTAPSVFTVPQSSLLAANNSLVFKQKTSGYIWGVSEVTLEPVTGIALTVGTTDTNHYGYRHGSNQNKDDVTFTFDGNASNISLSVVGYDIDIATEVEVILNGSSIGYLTVGANNQHTLPSIFILGKNKLQAVDNSLVFKQKTSGYIWGISDISLSAIIENPLLLNSSDTNHYGHRHGSNQNKDNAAFSFDGNSSDLTLSVVGFDIDVPTEVEVILNGNSIGYLSAGTNNQHTAPSAFTLERSDLLATGNSIVFKQKTSGYIWGVSDITLSTITDIPLTQGVVDTNHYGYRHGNYEKKTEASFTFDGNSSDLTLSVVGYDIDLANEVEVILNGSSLGFLSTGPNNQHTATNNFFLSSTNLLTQNNVLVFKQTYSSYTWGISNILVQ